MMKVKVKPKMRVMVPAKAALKEHIVKVLDINLEKENNESSDDIAIGAGV